MSCDSPVRVLDARTFELPVAVGLRLQSRSGNVHVIAEPRDDVLAEGDRISGGLTEDGEWGAIDNVCTHDGGVLGEGELDDNAVECPRHGGRFDLFSGRVLSLPPVIPVHAYVARQIGDEVQVELDA